MKLGFRGGKMIKYLHKCDDGGAGTVLEYWDALYSIPVQRYLIGE
jgi:hypothetical protein